MQQETSADQEIGWKTLLGFAGRMAYEGVDLPTFLNRFRNAGPMLGSELFTKLTLQPGDAERMAGALGFAIWRAMPQPDHGWRPVPTPLPGRNDSCYCGSGRKYKRCCASVPLPSGAFEQFNMLRYLLDAFPASRFDGIPRERLDPLALADTAQQWLEEGDATRAEQLLAPLFKTPERLDARHAAALEALMDTWLALNRPRKRTALVDTLIGHADTEIAITAAQRKVTILADTGDWNGAWALFQSALRRAPDDPSFGQLEITLLIAQGRGDEAQARAEFWAKRLRRLDPDYADYADSILDLARDPDQALAALGAGVGAGGSELLSLWNTLLEGAPAPAGAYALRTDTTLAALEPTRELAGIEKRWRRSFAVQEPVMTSFESDPGALLEDVPAVARFLQKHPLAWQSFQVLDDLARAVHWMCMVESARTPWLALQNSLAERGVALLALLLPAALAPPAPFGDTSASEDLRLIQSVDGGGLTLPWETRANRPALRLIALQIDALQELEPADARIPRLMAWLIRLNPNDNHGYRAVLAQEWLRASQPETALALMDRYPNDIAAAEANRALALLLLDRRDEAAAHWAAIGGWVVEIRRALLAKRYPRPRELDQDFVSVGGKADAWLYREVMRDTWVQSGALRWLAEQPAPKAVRAARKPRVAEPPAPLPGKTLQDDAAASSLTGQSATAIIAQGTERLAKIGGDPVRAHGIMVAAALAPDGGSPAGWISLLIKPSPDFEPAFTSIDDANRLLGALTAWYNAIVDELGPTAPDGPRVGTLSSPWLAERTSDAVSRWAAGFMAYVAAEPYAWRKLGPANHPTLLAPLRQLAARAPLTATEKSDPSRVRDRADDDAPLLALVDDTDPVALLDHALTRLVERVGSLRAYSPKGKR